MVLIVFFFTKILFVFVLLLLMLVFCVFFHFITLSLLIYLSPLALSTLKVLSIILFYRPNKLLQILLRYRLTNGIMIG